MKLGIMQPYFMPYLGYFSLIQACDRFILFDTPQFIRHGWIERNRILKPDGETLYIKVPLIKHGQKTPIREVRINNDLPWKEKIIAQLVPYKRKARHYSDCIALLSSIFEGDYDSIVELNRATLESVGRYIGIDRNIEIWSSINAQIEPVNSPDEWALNICRSLGGDEYYNLPGGKSFFDSSKYNDAGVKLRFIENSLTPYSQFGNPFVAGLSIVDLLMFCSPEEISKMAMNYQITGLD